MAHAYWLEKSNNYTLYSKTKNNIPIPSFDRL